MSLMSDDEYESYVYPERVQHLTAFGNSIKYGRINTHRIYLTDQPDKSVDKIEISVDDEGDIDVSLGYFLDKYEDMRCMI